MGRWLSVAGGIAAILGAGLLCASAEDPDPGAAQPAGPARAVARKEASDAAGVRLKAKVKPGGRRPKRAAGEGAPPCPGHRRAAGPPAQSMPELFERMGRSLATNPATGFNTFLGELSRMEETAVRGIAVILDEERRAGRKARAEYLENAARRGFREVNDAIRLDYLRSVVDRLAARMVHRDRYPKIEVTLINAPISDGQSFPGGFLVFTTALLDEPDEATVAGVVAHELAHLDLGHLYGYVRRSKLAETGMGRVPAPGPGVSFDRVFTQQAALLGMILNPFRPEHELEADCAAVTWMYLEGYDPAALVGFFERMQARKNDQPDNPFLAFGRTHPYSLDRRDHVRARLAQLQRWRPRGDLKRFAEDLRGFRIKDPKK